MLLSSCCREPAKADAGTTNNNANEATLDVVGHQDDDHDGLRRVLNSLASADRETAKNIRVSQS